MKKNTPHRTSQGVSFLANLLGRPKEPPQMAPPRMKERPISVRVFTVVSLVDGLGIGNEDLGDLDFKFQISNFRLMGRKKIMCREEVSLFEI
jgi:hypothetical protein